MFNTMFQYDEAKRIYAVSVGSTPVGELYMEADGCYVFDPIVGRTGYWPAWMMQSIVDKLTELNAEWEEHLTKALGQSEGLDSGEGLEVN